MNQEDAINAIFDEKKELQANEDCIHMLLHEKISADIETPDETPSQGDRMADRLTGFVGSWGFIIGFLAVLAFWIVLNTVLLAGPFDPYPFIFLNLVLSCIAAIQAPIIMMSQNRQDEKDRIRAKNDYRVNLKSEFIVEDLHESIDKVLENQQKIFERLALIESKIDRAGGIL